MDVVWLLEFPFNCFLYNCPQSKSLSNIVDTISTSIGRKCSSICTSTLSHLKLLLTNHFLFAYYLIQTPIIIDSIDALVSTNFVMVQWNMHAFLYKKRSNVKINEDGLLNGYNTYTEVYQK